MKIIKRYAIPFFLLTLLSASVYGGTLNYPFVFDDHLVVICNPTLRHISSIPGYFTKLSPGGEEDTTGLCRPMVFSSYAVNYLLFGLDTFSYHLFDVVLHIINSFLLFLIIAELQKIRKKENRPVALLFAALFCIHPVLTQSVIYISARSVLIMTLFCMSSLLVYLYYRATERAQLLALSAFLFACALLAKESAPPFIGVIILTEYYFKQKHLDSLKTSILRIMPFVAETIIFVTDRSYCLSKSVKTLLVGEYVAHWLAEISIVPRYLLVILYPPWLCVDHYVPDVQLGDPNLWVGAGIITVLLLLLFILLRRDVLLACLLAWPLFALLPEMILPLPERMMEYRLYLPMAGLTAFFSVAYSKWSAGISRPILRSATAIMVVCLAILGVFTYKAGKVWASPIALWQDVVNKYPDNGRSHYNLGVAYDEYGLHLRPDKAIEEFQAALKIRPDFAEAHYGLGHKYYCKGWVDKAIVEYRIALNIWPNYAEAHNNLGVSYFSKGMLDKAIDEYQTAIRLRPDYADAHHNLGLTLLQKGFKVEAVTELECAARLKPETPHMRLYNQ